MFRKKGNRRIIELKRKNLTPEFYASKFPQLISQLRVDIAKKHKRNRFQRKLQIISLLDESIAVFDKLPYTKVKISETKSKELSMQPQHLRPLDNPEEWRWRIHYLAAHFKGKQQWPGIKQELAHQDHVHYRDATLKERIMLLRVTLKDNFFHWLHFHCHGNWKQIFHQLKEKI